MTVAHFIDRFGPQAYFGWNSIVDAEEYRTRDGCIPWRLYHVLTADLRHVYGMDRLNLSQGVGAAIDLAFEENKARAQRKVDDLLQEALPGLTT